MANSVNVSDKITQEQFRIYSAPLVLDLVELFKVIEQDIIDLVNNASEYTEDGLYFEIEKIIGE